MNDDETTVIDQIRAELDPEQIHGISLTAQRGETYYAIVAQSAENNGGDVLDLRTVVVDLGDETVRVGDNGLWLPRDPDVAESLMPLLARSVTDMCSDDEIDEPALTSAVDVDPNELLDQRVEADDYERDDYEAPDWGDGHGPPPEIEILIDRLDAAGIETSDRFSRLEFGAKTPWDRELRDVDELLGNYGVETTDRDELVVIDVDDPDAAPLDEIPETFAVTSPHGSDERAHHYLRIDFDEKRRVLDGVGSGAIKPGWGDVWVAGEYVVGPGCVLDGCSKDDCDGGCDDPDGGRYEIIDDREIATIGGGDLISLVDRDEPDELADEPSDDGAAEPVDVETGTDVEADDPTADCVPATLADGGDRVEQGDVVECENCGDEIGGEQAVVFASDDETTVYRCKGGCEVDCHDCGTSIPQWRASLIASDGERQVWRCKGGCE